MAAVSQLLFLYELECKVCIADWDFDHSNIYLWFAVIKMHERKSSSLEEKDDYSELYDIESRHSGCF